MLPEVGATRLENFLQEVLYKPLEYLIYWRLNANFLTLVGPLPMVLLSIWLFFFTEDPPRIGEHGREGALLSEGFLLAFGLSMIFSSLIDAFDGDRARRQGCGSTFGGFFDCFMDGIAAILETNIFLFIFNFKDGASYWNMAITIVPPLYLYTIQIRMMIAHKAKYNWYQVGPTESETLIGLIILLPAFFGNQVFETIIYEEIQGKHIAAGAYLIVQALLIYDCIAESLIKNAKESFRYYMPMIPLQVLFFIGCTSSSLNFM